MFLGDLEVPQMALRGSPTDEAWLYAAQRVIEGRPRRQFVAPDAPTLTLQLALHVAFVDVAWFVGRVRALADAHEVLTVQSNGGAILGDFVIEKLSWVPASAFADGTPISGSMTIALADPGLGIALEPKPRPMGVVGEADDIVTTPKAEDTTRPPGTVTPAEIARL